MLNQLPVFFDHSRHKLTVRDLDATPDILAFEGTETLSQPFNYRVEFTCRDGDLGTDKILDQSASFSLYGPAPKPMSRCFAAPIVTPVTTLPAGYTGGYTLKDEAQAAMPFTRYRVTTQQGEVFNGVTDKDGLTMSVHTLMPGDLKVELPESEKWIRFSAPSDLNYQGIKCTATMDDGTVLQGEFDSENTASFYSFAGTSCVKFELEDLDRQSTELSGAEKILKELGE